MSSLLSSKVEPDVFLDIINTVQWLEETTLLAFSPHCFWFEPLGNENKFLHQSESGRIFNPEGELKWRKVDQRFQLVYLGKNHLHGTLDDFSHELKELSPSFQELFLWGERTELKNEWIEQQIPHRLNYHISSNDYPRGRIKLVIEEWKNSAGVSCFIRYHSLKEVQGEKNA